MDFGIYAANHFFEQLAGHYYRIEVPMRMLNKLGYAETWIDSLKSASRNTQQSAMGLFAADIAHFYSPSGEGHLQTLNGINKLHSIIDDSGERIYPPSTVFDIDDNFEFIHPFNGSYAVNGIRTYPAGELLEADDNISTITPEGKEVVLWQDMVTKGDNGIVFDIMRNRRNIAITRAIVRASHGVTVPSRALARYMRDVIKHPNVYEFPNTVVPDDYFHPNLAPHEGVRILWQGGASHMVDWWPLRDALREVAQRYPQAKFVIFGSKFASVHNSIPPEQLEFHDWVDYQAYKIWRTSLDIDINLCPLARNAFNACKTAIKWYEGSLGPRPEATLAAATEPYDIEIRDGDEGLLYNSPAEFVQKLGLLIEDAELRMRLGQASKQWILDNRTPEATIPGLFAFYEELRAQRRREIVLP